MKKLVCLLSFVLVLVGCAGPTKSEATPTPSPTASPTVDQGQNDSNNGELSPLQTKVEGVIQSGKYELPKFIMAGETELETLYYLNAADVSDYAIFIPMMNVQATEIIAIEAVNGKVDVVQEGIAKRLADLDATWSQYLPSQYELVQNYIMFTQGNTVVVVIAEDAQAIADDIKATLK